MEAFAHLAAEASMSMPIRASERESCYVLFIATCAWLERMNDREPGFYAGRPLPIDAEPRDVYAET